MGTVLVELLQVPFELLLKRILEFVNILEATRAKAELLRFANPSYQLQLAFMFRVISAFTVLLVPVPAEFFVCGPILPLAIDASKARQ